MPLTRATVDLADPVAAAAAVRAADPDVVFSLAAGRAKATAAERAATVAVNTSPWLVDALPDRCRTVVRLGSSTEYAASPAPLTEDAALEPRGFFGATKAAGSLLLRAAAAERGRPVGGPPRLPGLRPRRPPDPAGAGRPRRRAHRGDRAPARPAQPARLGVGGRRRRRVPARGRPTTTLPPGVVLNIGTGVQTSTEELVETAAAATGRPIATAAGAHPGRDWDTADWVCDPAAARALLGWTPTVDLAEGLARTWAVVTHERRRRRARLRQRGDPAAAGGAAGGRPRRAGLAAAAGRRRLARRQRRRGRRARRGRPADRGHRAGGQRRAARRARHAAWPPSPAPTRGSASTPTCRTRPRPCRCCSTAWPAATWRRCSPGGGGATSRRRGGSPAPRTGGWPRGSPGCPPTPGAFLAMDADVRDAVVTAVRDEGAPSVVLAVAARGAAGDQRARRARPPSRGPVGLDRPDPRLRQSVRSLVWARPALDGQPAPSSCSTSWVLRPGEVALVGHPETGGAPGSRRRRWAPGTPSNSRRTSQTRSASAGASSGGRTTSGRSRGASSAHVVVQARRRPLVGGDDRLAGPVHLGQRPHDVVGALARAALGQRRAR